MQQVVPIFKREFLGYFRSPIAYVFLATFHLAVIGMAFFVGGLFKGNAASLDSVFTFLPWLYMFFVPAVGMRLWAEEKRSGTIELLFTLPISTAEAVIGKFLAGWAFICVALVLTWSMVLTTTYLGDPDWGAIAGGYVGSILMAAAYLAICSLTSSLTQNQIISFVVSVGGCLVLVLLGWDAFGGLLSNIMPVGAVDFLSTLGFITHFMTMTRGLIDVTGAGFFAILTIACLALNVVALDRSL